MSCSPKPRPRRARHAQLHLPPLRADQAALVVALLEGVIKAIYRAHGQAMADLFCDAIDPSPSRSAPMPDPSSSDDLIF